MRNSLVATSAFAFAGAMAMGQASAADMLSVGIGGYMQQWVGMASVDDSAEMVKDGTAQQSDSEIHFKGKLESDSGLTFSVKVELEGNSKDGTQIDESQLTIGGEFGKITLGAEDPASTLTHHGGLDVGITLNCGDTHKWIGGLAGCSHNGFGTYGHGHGDKNQIMYFTPRINGVQLGASYIPDAGQEGETKALNDNDDNAWAVGANYVGDFGDGLNIAVSLGHYQRSQTGKEEMVFDGKNRVGASPVNSLYRVRDQEADEMAIANLAKALMGETADDADNTDPTDPTLLENLRTGANMASMRMMNHMTSMMKADDKTFTNAALQVGMGSFSFGVVYATNDGGAYTTMDANRPLTQAEFSALQSESTATATQPYASTASYNPTTGVVVDTANTGQWGEGISSDTAEAADTNNDPSNDNPMIRMSKLAEDESKNWDTWGAGVKYSEGPMAVSLSHLATEWDNGDEQEATMLSVSYTLGPGVASKTSIFMAEKSLASNGREIDGTAFVTGIAIGF